MVMLTRIVPSGLTANRLDPTYYRPEYLRDAQLRAVWRRALLDELRSPSAPIVYGVLKPDDQGEKFRVAKAERFEGMFVSAEDCDPVSEEMFHEFGRAEAIDGDLLIAIGGYVGRPALLRVDDGLRVVVNRHLARVRIDKARVDSGWVLAYFSSARGERQLTREITGSVQAGINLCDLRLVDVPLPALDAQRYIGDKVRQAERLRERARRLRSGLIQQFDAMVSERVRLLGSSRSWRIAGRGLEHRLDPGANHVRLVALREDLRAAGPTRALGDLIANSIPAGVSLSEFTASGPLYVRISDFGRGYWDSSAASVSPEHHLSNAKGHFRPGDVVFARIGNTLGKVGFADRHMPTSSLSNNCSLIRPLREEHGPWIFWCLRSALGDVQTGCLKSQTAQPKISNEDIEAIVLPDPDLRPADFNAVSYTHLTLPTNREV